MPSKNHIHLLFIRNQSVDKHFKWAFAHIFKFFSTDFMKIIAQVINGAQAILR